ncbi:hypothetical protein Q1695_010504 [Nippostrongylus brasiliensis]|nr:hypothetical protein Q1695_010504 [Nippostrongylus brasiliensis]
MSTKHLRRLIEEKASDGVIEQEDKEEEEAPRRNGPVNRFAAFADDEDAATRSDSDEEQKDDREEEKSESPEHEQQPVGSKAPINIKSQQKSNKKQKKKKRKRKDEEVDEEELLERLVIENREVMTSIDEGDLVGVEELLKTDPRLFDAAAELKRALARNFKEATASNRSHRGFHGVGKIVKQKNTWPPIKSIGLSMELDREEGGVKWFKFVHNTQYERLERMCWAAEDSLDHSLIEEILASNPYHLNSLLLLANVFRMQEDITQSCDMIERGLHYCQQSMASQFQPSSFHHRVDYLDYENRAFYLLLHRHMLNCVHKRCFETALNYAKLLFTMDPQRDPLAVLLIIDTIAIKAKQYKWLQDLYKCCKEWKNLDKLPNFCYSLALAQFLSAKTTEDSDEADRLLSHAVCAFPGVVTTLLDKLQIEADPLVESHKHLGVFALNKQGDGLKMVFKIYASETAELWKAPETLAWLERVTRSCAQDDKLQETMERWKEERKRLFIGTPMNIRRLAILLGFDSSSSAVTNPAPPLNGRARYTREDEVPVQPDSFLSGFIHSIWPDYARDQHLMDALRRAGAHLQQAFLPQNSPADRPPNGELPQP